MQHGELFPGEDIQRATQGKITAFKLLQLKSWDQRAEDGKSNELGDGEKEKERCFMLVLDDPR